MDLAEGTQVPPHTQPAPSAGPSLAPTWSQHVCSPTGSTETARRDAAAFPALPQTHHTLLVCATAARRFMEEGLNPCLPQEESSPQAAPGPRPAWAAGAPGVRAFAHSQGPYSLGGRRGCTCSSRYCFLSTKNSQMFGNESFCLCWLWHFLDSNEKLQIIHVTNTNFPRPLSILSIPVFTDLLGHIE